MKSYTKGLMVGLSITLLALIFMGNTNYIKDKSPRFEIHTANSEWVRGILLDNETGDTWYITEKSKYKHDVIKTNK
tara:strand:+ start:1044 stop:1271 length:228 start_codon:yes stop_codon:yes gene_type:complete